MRRRGFTLVELLIIVAIIGALAATMTVSNGSSIAKSKATAIANNLRICTTGSHIYYLTHEDDVTDTDSGTTVIGSVKCTDMLTEAVPNFSEFSTGNTTYKATGDTGPDSWTVTVTLAGTDKEDVLKALKAIQGFSAVDSSKSSVVYTVFKGTAAAPTD